MGAGSSSSSSSSPSEPPNACCSFFLPHPLITKAFGSEKILVWKLLDTLGAHVVRLEHDIFTGRRLIVVDGTVVYQKAHQLLDMGSTHTFSVGVNPCELRIVETGVEYGYALSVNGMPYARFRSEFWKYATLWYIPRSGTLQGLTNRDKPAAAASAAVAGSSASSPTAVASVKSKAAEAAEAKSNADTTTSPIPAPLSHTIVAITHPQLTVLVNGVVVELHSRFSAEAGESGIKQSESTQHTFYVPREKDEEVEDEDQAVFYGAAGTHSQRNSSLQSSSSSSSATPIECELTVWLDKSDPPLPAGHVQSHIPRDKRHGRYRFVLRMDGQIVASATNPLVSTHSSLRNSAANSSDRIKRDSAGATSNNNNNTSRKGSGAAAAAPVPRHGSKSSLGELAVSSSPAQRASSGSGSGNAPPPASLLPPASLPVTSFTELADPELKDEFDEMEAEIQRNGDFGLLSIHPNE